MKDLFSKHSASYAKYRPKYPQALYDYIFGYVKHFDCAWDCATGNGQAAAVLAKKFKKVIATDLSESQISQAEQHPNISYSVCLAENTPFKSKSFDLVTVAQALHWFDFDPFYTELKRVLKPDGVFAAWCYDLARVTPEVNKVMDYFYYDLIATYWESRRELIDEKYETIPFPLKKIDVPSFTIEAEWDLEHFIKYVETWSAVQTYIQKHNSNPIDLVKSDLEKAWGQNQTRKITWPIYLLLGS
jgi:ubiquinone/menaquinone biosynthesis C-methylase UbiE